MINSPDAKFNQQVWEVLQEIEFARLATVKGRPVKYKVPDNIAGGFVSKHRIEEIIYKLEEWKILVVQRNAQGTRRGESDLYYLDILQSVYNEFYLECKRKQAIESPFNSQESASARVVITDLESRYNEIEKEQNKVQFFIKIANYGKYVLENPLAVVILKPLYQEAINDAKPYLDSWLSFIKIWKGYAQDILEKAEKAGIKDDLTDPFSNEIATIKRHLNDKKTSVLEIDLQYYYNPYQTLVWKFDKLNKSHLLIPKHLLSIESGKNEVVLFTFYQEVKNEWDIFKVNRESKVWWAHYQICRLAAGVLNLNLGDEYFKEGSVIDGIYKSEFNELVKGNPQNSPIVLHFDRYVVWIRRLHEYLVPRLKESFVNQLQSSGNKEPVHVVVDDFRSEIGIKGLEEKVVLQKSKNKKIALRKFPSDTKWEDISIQFVDEHEVQITVKNERYHTTYEEMGFQDERKRLPNKQWDFLLYLSMKRGELSWQNNQNLPVKKILSATKTKQLLKEALQTYFQINDDPFFDYKAEKAYRIKITLIPAVQSNAFPEQDENYE